MSIESIASATPSFTPLLLARLRHDDPTVRRRAAHAVARLEKAEAIPVLAEVSLSDHDSGVRAAAVTALALLDASSDVLRANAIRLLSHGEAEVRARAGWAIGKLGRDGREPVDALCDRLANDPAIDGRFGAAWALGRIRSDDTRAVVALTRALELDPEGDMRAEAARSLGRIGCGAATAAPALASRLTDRDPLVREEAARALGLIGELSEEAVEGLRAGLADPAELVRLAAAAALRCLGEAAPPEPVAADGVDDWREFAPALAELARRLETDGDFGRAEVPWLIGKLGLPEGAAMTPSLLVQSLVDRDSDARWSALHALRRVGAPHIDTTTTIVQALGSDEDPDVRSAAAAALGVHWRQAAESTRIALEAALDDPDPLVREEAADALGVMGPAAGSSAHALAARLDDPHPGVRERARCSLEVVTRE